MKSKCNYQNKQQKKREKKEEEEAKKEISYAKSEFNTI